MLAATIRIYLRTEYRILDCLLGFIDSVRRVLPQHAFLNKNLQPAGSVVEINRGAIPRWDTFQTLTGVGK